MKSYRAICGTVWQLVVRSITISDDWLHNLILLVQLVNICWWFHIKGARFKIALDIFVILECLKISSRHYCILQSLTKFTPNLMQFSGYTCMASTWFYVTDIRICNDYTLDNVLLNFISISFHLLIPILLCLFRLKYIHAGQNVHHF